MSLSAAAIRLLASKGLSVDEIASVAEANETETGVSAAAMRTRRWREKRHKASQSVTETKAEAVTETVTNRHETSQPRAHVRDITSNSENNHNHTLLSASAVSDDWPEGGPQVHAKLICAELESPWLDQNKSPGLVTTVGLLDRWRRAGASWQHDVLPLIAGRLMNRRKPVTTWAFFDEAIAETVAANRAAMVIPEAGTVVPFRGTGPPSIAAQIAEENRLAREAVLAMPEFESGR
jgi:hypothetical protein